MEDNDTGDFSELITQSNRSPMISDIREMAMSYMMYKVGKRTLLLYLCKIFFLHFN